MAGNTSDSGASDAGASDACDTSDEDESTGNDVFPLAKWFRHDWPNKNSKDSWFHRLVSVANSVLIQLICLRQGYQTRGGTTTLYKDDSIRALLMRIPTPTGSGDSVPHPRPDYASVARRESRVRLVAADDFDPSGLTAD
jgi:hypothetical protein